MSTPKFCWSCGALVDPGDTVCSSCGVKLRDVTPKADTKPGATSQPDVKLKNKTGNTSDLAPVTAPRVGWQPGYQRSEGIQVLNKWGWVASLFVGSIVLVSGGLSALIMIPIMSSVCSGTLAAFSSSCPTMATNYITEAIVEILFSLFGIIAGLVTKNKIVPLISARDYKAAEKPLLIWAIVGCLCYGGGVLLLFQYILIKIGKN